MRDGVARARIQSPHTAALCIVTLGQGAQIDVRSITSADFDDAADLTDVRVARYVAKSATKSAESAGVELPPTVCRACSGTGRTLVRVAGHDDALLPCCPAAPAPGSAAPSIWTSGT